MDENAEGSPRPPVGLAQLLGLVQQEGVLVRLGGVVYPCLSSLV